MAHRHYGSTHPSSKLGRVLSEVLKMPRGKEFHSDELAAELNMDGFQVGRQLYQLTGDVVEHTQHSTKHHITWRRL